MNVPITTNIELTIKEVHKFIHEIDRCMTIIKERETNLGLGKTILTGVTEILKKEEMGIVSEDDQICVTGTSMDRMFGYRLDIDPQSVENLLQYYYVTLRRE